MQSKTIDLVLQRAINLGLALVVTLGMLGGIDSLAQPPHLDMVNMAATASAQG
jgi:hypothetical protein